MRKEQGQILLVAIIFMSIVLTAVASAMGDLGVQIKSHRQAVARVQGLSIAEAGAELALWKLNNQIGYNGESNTSYGAGVYTVTITGISGGNKTVKVDSYVP